MITDLLEGFLCLFFFPHQQHAAKKEERWDKEIKKKKKVEAESEQIYEKSRRGIEKVKELTWTQPA